MYKRANKVYKNANNHLLNMFNKEKGWCHRIRYIQKMHSVVRLLTFHMQIYAVDWPEGGAVSQYSVFIGQYMQLIGSYLPEQVA